MALVTLPHSAWRWTLDKTCELIIFAALAVSVIGLLRGPLEPGLATWLGHLLETRIPNSDLEKVPKIGGIIVLGGSVARVEAGIEIADTFPNLPVILSGPGENEIQYATTHIGNAADRLIIDRRPTSTYQNARYARDSVNADSSALWILVTSAIHMPRAIGVFQALSLPVLPWLVDDTPSVPKKLSRSVWHEVRGLIAYRLLGRTDSFFPRLKRSRGL